MTKMTNQTHLGLSLTAQLSRWWRSQSTAGRKLVLRRGGLGGACFAAVLVGMPILSSVNVERQDAQQFRERNERLAVAQDAGDVLRADPNASPLLQHDWLRSVEYSLERDPDSALSRYAGLERDRAALAGLQTLEIGSMSRAENMVAETRCLSQAVYYEARSEKSTGQLAVAEVIMNRVKDHRYPNSICGVVFQGATRTTGCQFTFTCDGALRKQPYGSRWDAAQIVASHVVMGLNERRTGGATHYHATYVNPVWNSGLVRTSKIGTHIFYRFPRGREWAAASAKQTRRLAQRRSGLSTIVPAVAAPETVVKAIKTAAPAAIPVAEPIAAPDLNAAQLQNLTIQPVLVETTPISKPVVTRRIVRRVVNGEVVQEREVPVASAGTIGPATNSAS